MSELAWITASGLLMSAIALVGSVTLLLSEAALRKLLLPLVALAAGALLGGALFHMIPAALDAAPQRDWVWLLVLIGFALFLALEQFLHWHHCHRARSDCKQPLTYLILIGDGLHNLLGGLAIAGTFLIDVRVGIAAWIAAAAHEVPQELGDFAVLIHGGWPRGQALLFNFASGLMFLLGGLITYAMSFSLDVWFLIPIAAGNFLYIGATDLVPELTAHRDPAGNALHWGMFVLGAGLMYATKLIGL